MTSSSSSSNSLSVSPIPPSLPRTPSSLPASLLSSHAANQHSNTSPLFNNNANQTLHTPSYEPQEIQWSSADAHTLSHAKEHAQRWCELVRGGPSLQHSLRSCFGNVLLLHQLQHVGRSRAMNQAGVDAYIAITSGGYAVLLTASMSISDFLLFSPALTCACVLGPVTTRSYTTQLKLVAMNREGQGAVWHLEAELREDTNQHEINVTQPTSLASPVIIAPQRLAIAAARRLILKKSFIARDGNVTLYAHGSGVMVAAGAELFCYTDILQPLWWINVAGPITNMNSGFSSNDTRATPATSKADAKLSALHRITAVSFIDVPPSPSSQSAAPSSSSAAASNDNSNANGASTAATDTVSAAAAPTCVFIGTRSGHLLQIDIRKRDMSRFVVETKILRKLMALKSGEHEHEESKTDEMRDELARKKEEDRRRRIEGIKRSSVISHNPSLPLADASTVDSEAAPLFIYSPTTPDSTPTFSSYAAQITEIKATQYENEVYLWLACSDGSVSYLRVFTNEILFMCYDIRRPAPLIKLLLLPAGVILTLDNKGVLRKWDTAARQLVGMTVCDGILPQSITNNSSSVNNDIKVHMSLLEESDDAAPTHRSMPSVVSWVPTHFIMVCEQVASVWKFQRTPTLGTLQERLSEFIKNYKAEELKENEKLGIKQLKVAKSRMMSRDGGGSSVSSRPGSSLQRPSFSRQSTSSSVASLDSPHGSSHLQMPFALPLSPSSSASSLPSSRRSPNSSAPSSNIASEMSSPLDYTDISNPFASQHITAASLQQQSQANLYANAFHEMNITPNSSVGAATNVAASQSDASMSVSTAAATVVPFGAGIIESREEELDEENEQQA